MPREKSTQLREQRDEALLEAYQRVLETGTAATQSEAYDKARHSASPRFFISAEFASVVIGRMIAGGPSLVSGKNNIRKFEELYRRFCKRVKEGDGRSRIAICFDLVQEEAPEFYINERITREIIVKKRKEKCNKMVHRYAER